MPTLCLNKKLCISFLYYLVHYKHFFPENVLCALSVPMHPDRTSITQAIFQQMSFNMTNYTLLLGPDKDDKHRPTKAFEEINPCWNVFSRVIHVFRFKHKNTMPSLNTMRTMRPHEANFKKPSCATSDNKFGIITTLGIQCAVISHYIEGLVQDCNNSSVLAMESLHSCTEPSICFSIAWFCIYSSNDWDGAHNNVMP